MRQLNRIASASYLFLDAVLEAVRYPRGAHVLVACMPKSASTSLTNAIAAYPGFRKVALAAAYGSREQELCQIRLSRYNHRGPYVAQQHLRNSSFTQSLIEQYRLAPIVLVRDLSDVVLSIRDHLHRESRESPIAIFTPEHLRQSPAELEETIVRIAMPWYLSFYVGWRSDRRAHIVAYEDLVRDPQSAIEAILRFSGIEPQEQYMPRVLEAFRGPNNRINVGVSGRGRLLGSGAAAALGHLLDQYRECDADPYFRRMRSALSATVSTT
ncbi:MAG: hypothetical protein EBR10_07690 [Planctomycetes bacterium]|nr:hypothetical protein [Planctomycetota bacterium]